jgi:CRP-like cAMP-binding protein
MDYRNPYIELIIEGASSIFRGLSPVEKEMLDSHHTFSDKRKGELIIREGDKSRGFSVLASGKAKLYRIGAGDREQIIKMLRPQSVVLYRSLFSDNPNAFSAETIEDSTIVTFKKPVLLKIFRQNPDVCLRFMKIMAEDLVQTNNRLISLTQKHVRGRLAESLLLLRDTYGLEADGRTLRVMLPREDIAHLSNMTTSNAIRTLSNFVSEEIIEMERRKIIIRNAPKLEEISESGQ